MKSNPAKNKYILDACCGGRMMWSDKKYPHALFIDKRVAPKGFMRLRKNFSVEPDVQADFRDIPFRAGSFNLVVFDPPHTVRKNDSGSFIAERYGRLTLDTWEEDLALEFQECWRVLKKKGVLIFKWAEVDVKLEDMEHFFPAAPLFGSRLGKNNKTVWLVFMKI